MPMPHHAAHHLPMKAHHSPRFQALKERAKSRLKGEHPMHPKHRRPMSEEEQEPKSQLDEMPPTPGGRFPENEGQIPNRAPKPTNQGESQQGEPEEEEEENGY